MRRVESDPEEQREIADAMSRAATPMHEQPTEEFDSQLVIDGLQRVTSEWRISLTDGVPIPLIHEDLGDSLL